MLYLALPFSCHMKESAAFAVNENKKGRVISNPAFLVRETSSPTKTTYASLDVDAKTIF
jgi:hypothetical protein